MKKIENKNNVAQKSEVLLDRFGRPWIPPTEAEIRESLEEAATFKSCGSWRFDFAIKGGEILTPTGGKKK
jgi:hypothetical protein